MSQITNSQLEAEVNNTLLLSSSRQALDWSVGWSSWDEQYRTEPSAELKTNARLKPATATLVSSGPKEQVGA
jgi:hypothetical protein